MAPNALQALRVTPSMWLQQRMADALSGLGVSPYRANKMTHTAVDALTNFTPLGTVDEIAAQSRANRAAMAAGRAPDTFQGNALMAVLAGVPGGKAAGKAAGLAMDEASRMARAKAMGFDVDAPVFHGTAAQFDEFRPSEHGALGGGVYVGSPQLASAHAARRSGEGDPGIVLPLLAPSGPWATQEDFDILYSKLGKRSGGREAITNALKDRGFIGVDDGTGSRVIFDPSQVRSRFAAFDPAKRNSKNLMAGVAGAGVTGAAMTTERDRDGGI